MGKKKFIPLTMMLLCSLCFSTSCTDKSSTTNIIAKVDGGTIKAEDIYDYSLYNETTAAYIYEVLEKALINSAVPATNSMKTKVENEVEKWQNQIKENASLNNTDYDEDLKTALEEEGVSSIGELKEKKIYALQFEYAKEKFLKANQDTYRNTYISTNYLYHVGDITLSISSSSENTDLYGLTISGSEAKNIYNVFNELVEGEKYYNIASKYSKADSASNGGDLGIVTLNDTDITNELRYALVGYSSIVEGKYSSFNLPTNKYSANLTELYNSGMQTIPYSYIKKLNDNISETSETKHYDDSTNYYYSGGGNSVSSSAKVYYRNIVFNNLLNTKTPKFITVSEEDVTNGANAVKLQVLTPDIDNGGYSSTKSEQYVLVNDEGNPYVVFKDSNGLHVMTINKTPFAQDLQDYYSSEINNDDQYVSYAEFGNQEVRLKEVESLATKYVTREYGDNTADEKLLNYAMFEYYLNLDNNGGFKIVNDDVKAMINQYITAARNKVDLKISEEYKGYYDTYSNVIWIRNQDIINKEVPLLACLVKRSDDRYGCTYTYGKGFESYTPSSGNEGGSN